MTDAPAEGLLKFGVALIMLALGVISMCAAIYVSVELIRYLK